MYPACQWSPPASIATGPEPLFTASQLLNEYGLCPVMSLMIPQGYGGAVQQLGFRAGATSLSTAAFVVWRLRCHRIAPLVWYLLHSMHTAC
jgi:hypothetical protein